MAIALVLISCSGDDDNKSSNVAVEGTWKMTVFSGETAVDLDMDGDSSNNLINSVTVTSDGASFSGTKDGDEITFVIPNGYDLEVVEGDGTAYVIEDLTIVYEKQ